MTIFLFLQGGYGYEFIGLTNKHAYTCIYLCYFHTVNILLKSRIFTLISSDLVCNQRGLDKTNDGRTRRGKCLEMHTLYYNLFYHISISCDKLILNILIV